MSYAQWKRLLEFGSSPPFAKELEKGLRSLQSGYESVKKVTSLAQKILSISSKFITGSIDLTSNAIRQYAVLFKSILSNISSLGGQFIVIHPWNRFHKKVITLNSDPIYSIRFPGLTPSEAFGELYQSFSNTNDKMRPRYGSYTQVAGFGFLIACQTPHDLAKTINAIRYFINAGELEEIVEKYRDQLTKQVNDLIAQNKITEANKLALESENLFKIVKMEQSIIGYNENGEEVEFTHKFIPKDHVLPEWWEYIKNKEPRWFGFSIINLPFVAEALYRLHKIIDDLTRISETSSDMIKKLVESILKKANHLISIIDEFYSFLVSVAQSLQLTNLYFFKIPPGTGGISYLTSSIQSSISSPSGDGVYVSQIWNTAQFSALIFFSSGYGVDTEKWYNSVTSVWETFIEKIKNLSIETVKNYWELTPYENSFFTYEKEYSIFPSILREGSVLKLNSSINFSIISTNESLYYSYILYLDDGIVSQFTSTDSQKAMVNKKGFNFYFDKEGHYRLHIIVKSIEDPKYISSRIIRFSVKSSIAREILMIPSPTVSIPLKDNQIGVASITDSDTGMTEQLYVYKPSDPLEIGNSFPPKESKVKVLFKNSNGENVLDFSFLLKKDTSFIYLKQIPSLIYVESYPASIYFDFEASLFLYDVSLGEESSVYVQLPNVLIVYKDSSYKYKYHVQEQIFSNWLEFGVQKKEKGFKDIC